MAGYVRKAKTFKLVFADPEFDGLEVRAKGASIGKLLTVSKLANQVRQDPELAYDLFAELVTVLVDWNLETEDDDGNRTPVPLTAEALLDQDQALVSEIVGAWLDAVSGVDADTKAPSSGGGPSPVVSLPMEALSESQ